MLDEQPQPASSRAGKPKPRLRYAPSPSGPLHAGNLSTALFTWLLADHLDGLHFFRMDNLDRVRCKPLFESQVLDAIRWLGIPYDDGLDGGSLFTQDPKAVRYADAFNELRRKGLVFPCFCSRREAACQVETEGGVFSVYSGKCLSLSQAEVERRMASGRPHAWRFKVGVEPVQFHDRALGEVTIEPAQWGGAFTVWRKDGFPAYALASVVDDAALGITEVTRGRDLLQPSAAQCIVYQALGLKRPDFCHLPLLTRADGQKLSKRDQDHAPHLHADQPTAFLGEWCRAFGLEPVGSIEELKERPWPALIQNPNPVFEVGEPGT